MDYMTFKKQISSHRQEILHETITKNRKSIRIKKEKTVLKNLDIIFKATLKISNKKGFQAMSMRDLRQETGISLGALYAYFSSKDDLLSMLQHHGRETVARIIDTVTEDLDHPMEQLEAMVRSHIYLSEIMQPWFYFSFMEAKNLSQSERRKAIKGDLDMGERLELFLKKGQEMGLFVKRDATLTAEMIKAQMTHWYLKRSKFRSSNVSVQSYADFVIESVQIHLGVDNVRPSREIVTSANT